MQKRTNKVVAGILVFAPILAAILMFIPMVTMLADISRMARYNIDERMPEGLMMFVIMVAIVVLLSLGGFIYYLIHAINNPYVNKDHRLAWILLMVFAGSLAHIVYFFMYIVPEGKDGPPPSF